MTVSVKDYFQTIFIMLKVRMRANFNTTIGILFCLMMSLSPFTNSKQRGKTCPENCRNKAGFSLSERSREDKIQLYPGGSFFGAPSTRMWGSLSGSRRDHKGDQRLEQLCREGRRELGLFSLEKASGRPQCGFSKLKGGF